MDKISGIYLVLMLVIAIPFYFLFGEIGPLFSFLFFLVLCIISAWGKIRNTANLFDRAYLFRDRAYSLEGWHISLNEPIWKDRKFGRSKRNRAAEWALRDALLELYASGEVCTNPYNCILYISSVYPYPFAFDLCFRYPYKKIDASGIIPDPNNGDIRMIAEDNSSIEEVILPAGSQSLILYADYCPNLSALVIPCETPPDLSMSFSEPQFVCVSPDFAIYVPDRALAAYENNRCYKSLEVKLRDGSVVPVSLRPISKKAAASH